MGPRSDMEYSPVHLRLCEISRPGFQRRRFCCESTTPFRHALSQLLHCLQVAVTKYRDVLEMWRNNQKYRPDIKLLDRHMCKTEWTLDMAVNINIWICQLALGRADPLMWAPDASQVIMMLHAAPQASMKAPRWLRCKYAHVMSVGFLYCGNALEAGKLMQHATTDCLPIDEASKCHYDRSRLYPELTAC